MKQNEKTDLEKSHSVWSNTKLTFLAMLGSIGFSGFFAVLGLFTALDRTIAILALLVSVLLCSVSIMALRKFTR